MSGVGLQSLSYLVMWLMKANLQMLSTAASGTNL